MDDQSHTPGPWSHHAGFGCKCGGVGSADHPIAKVYAGVWGDDYPSIRVVGSSLERVAEAYMEQITYGHIPQAEADANARLIAAAPDLLDALLTFIEVGDCKASRAEAAAAIAKTELVTAQDPSGTMPGTARQNDDGEAV